MNRGNPIHCAYIERLQQRATGSQKIQTPLLLGRARWSLPSSQSKQIHQQNVPGWIVPTQPRQLVRVSISLLTPPLGEDKTLCLALEGEKIRILAFQFCCQQCWNPHRIPQEEGGTRGARRAAVTGSYYPTTLQNHSFQLNDFSTWEISFTEQMKVWPYPKKFTHSDANRLASEEKVKHEPQKGLLRKAAVQLSH